MSQQSHIDAILEAFRPAPIAYCDFIADCIKKALTAAALVSAPGNLVSAVGHVASDLHPQGGYLLTTTKTIEVKDRNGRVYRVTVEEVR